MECKFNCIFQCLYKSSFWRTLMHGTGQACICVGLSWKLLANSYWIGEKSQNMLFFPLQYSMPLAYYEPVPSHVALFASFFLFRVFVRKNFLFFPLIFAISSFNLIMQHYCKIPV